MTRDFSFLRVPPRHRQRGNTLTGVIIGLVVGLVIAVVVALVINKGSMPFTDKSGKLGKMGEPTAGQAADPNKPLYGNKEAARAANKQFSDKAKEAEADPLGAAIAGMDKDATAATPATPAAAPPAAAPAAPAAAAAPAVPKVAAEPAEEKVIYFLQAGAFREVGDAENTRAKLALLGFEAVISEKVSDSGVLHRVRVGPYGQVESMNKARAKLLDSGIDVAIVRNQK
jgi:cell division protein FtsN